MNFTNLLAWVKSLGAGWWVEWRDKTVAVAKAAFHAVLDGFAAEAQPALIAAEHAALTAYTAAVQGGASVGDAAVTARNAAEQSIAASGNQMEADALNLALTAIVQAVQAGASA